jgi:hypothetical protein
MTLNAQGFEIINLPAISQEVLDSFSDLVFDPYMGKNRYRRFSQYKMQYSDGRWHLHLLPHRPYVTFKQYNRVAGGIKRYYEPLKVDFSSCILAGVNAIPLDTNDEWQINVHQYRVVVRPGIAGVVVPEGPHRDGHEYVMIAVFRRHQITGAEMSLLPLGGEGEPFFKTIVQEGRAALLDDRRMFHDVTEIEPIKDEGHRDIIVVAFSRWKEKWYGDDFDDKALVDG